jgi:hypothetical protein
MGSQMTAARAPADGLRLRAGMTFEAWVLAGRRLARVANTTAWALGDWLLFGERAYGDRYKGALEATGLDYQTLRNYAWVARRFAPERRHERLSFQHHAEVAALPDALQDLWLGRAVRLNWSRNELRRRLAAQRRPAGASRRAAVTMSVQVAAERQERWRRAAELADQALPEWMTAVADAAADAALAGRRS